MLVIRLQRTGRKNLATYRVVVAEHSKPVKGRFKDILGHYLPMRNPSVLEVDHEKVQEWIKKGAKPTDTVARLLKRDGMKDMDSYTQTYTKKRSKKAPPEEPEAPTPPPAAEAPAEAAPAAEEAPKEEAPAETKEEAAPAEEPAPETPEEPKAEEAAAESSDNEEKKS